MEATEKPNPTEGIYLCGLEKKLVEYLTANKEDRYLTVNRLALAVGANESLVKISLRLLVKSHIVVEREDADQGLVTFRIRQEPTQAQEPVTLSPTVTEKRLPDPVPQKSVGRPEGQSAESIEIDNKIKKLYPGKNLNEIAAELKISYGSVQGRIQRLREAGEITEYILPERKGGSKVPCPECGEMCGNKGGLTAHMRNQHGIKRDMDKEYADVDRKIKELYPAKGPTEIAKIVGVNAEIVSSRLTKMHKSGEITEYWNHRKPSKNPITTSINQTINRAISEPSQIREGTSQKSEGSFNIGQLLKVNSENQVDVVNATLEVIDDRGSEYEITIARTNKGLILTKELIKELIGTLEYRVEEIDNVAEDARQDDPDWFEDLMREQRACELILAKIRRDARIPEEKVK